MKISEILNKNYSDKCQKNHTYHYVYDDLFNKYDKYAQLDILESGIESGGSLSAWKEYFPNAKVTGVDIKDLRHPDFKRNDVEFIISDIKKYVPEKQFDLIIEDGNHSNLDALWSIINLSQWLKPGGILIIEDVQEGFTIPFISWGILEGDFAVSAIDLRRYTNTHDNFLIKIERWKP